MYRANENKNKFLFRFVFELNGISPARPFECWAESREGAWKVLAEVIPEAVQSVKTVELIQKAA